MEMTRLQRIRERLESHLEIVRTYDATYSAFIQTISLLVQLVGLFLLWHFRHR